ncbi:MAG: vitamin B12-dependent ribonucleotide reductase [Chloroherpetonaceae bacterium]|nr:vitamin B12-dependent ribonucleotide reductase [Chthonomonadaceae bacterium]MDW8206369.1 vitamin B12-dependent ribonucleotide reductase [Chloroherpetonaceae bacterium]
MNQEQTPYQTDIESVIQCAEVDGSSGAAVSRAGRTANGRAVVKTRVPADGHAKSRSPRPEGAPGLTVERRFTRPGEDVYSTVEWELRDAVITNERGEKVFEQKNVEIPRSWTQLATNVVVSKYFRGHIGTPQREHSVRQLIGRVANTIARWGREMAYFRTEEDAQAFQDELTHILLYQKAAFNSPVWFNVGLPDQPRPQASACFINSVQDTMESILELAKTEGMLFKYGSGTGTNLSTIRGSREPLQGGGTASGPLSFMRGFDQFAGAIKSGGKTRRAAKMVILNIDHPDIVEFITCKEKEEKKAWALIEAGYDGAFNVPGGAYDSVQFQNANHSVRVTDEFMHAVENDGAWQTRYVLSGEVAATYRARELMQMIAQSAWVCGDPGIQYDTTINRWHTCKNTDRIYASNPCSEYMFLDDSACNLASLNLMKFRHADGEFDIEAFRHACRIMITAQEILVDNASYPTPRIAENSHDYRPLGLGYANLGALLMARGLAYDSEAGRAYAAAITAIMTGEAYRQSAVIARDHGWPFPGYRKNREPFLEVMRMHRGAVDDIDAREVPQELLQAARQVWDEAIALGEEYGFRNAQATVLAPTGTIGFLMDCDTTGIEPDIALVKYKSLVGGGILKIVNNTVPEALRKLGYTQPQIDRILAYIDEKDTIEGAPDLDPAHLPVFDCAFKPANGERSIHYMGHVKMMAAVQPFLSGAISKTVNMPNDATPEDIIGVYMEGWKLGLKAIAIYRDGSKRTQPLSTKKTDTAEASSSDGKPATVQTPATPPLASRPLRRKLPDERQAITHKFSIAGHEGYITVGMYEDGTPGEIFLTMSKEGSTISGLMDSFATAISLALQYGVPLQTLVDKFAHTRFEPSGYTNNPDVRYAKSIMDYIFRWLGAKFLNRIPENNQPSLSNGHAEEPASDGAQALSQRPTLRLSSSRVASLDETGQETFQNQSDAPICADCGSLMVRNGACFKCLNCGSVLGCS